MKSLVIAMLTALLMGQTPTLPSHSLAGFCLLMRPNVQAILQEGNPGHKEPPPGWHCAHGEGSDKDHPCQCHRECKDEDELDDNGEPTGRKTIRVVEDAKCNSYCFKDHCFCGVHDCE